MLKKTIKYTDFDGNEQTEDFYFNLTKAELMEMNLSASGGLEKKLQRIINERDVTKIAEIFKDLILRAYGKKSDDGKRFIKNEEIKAEFAQTEAYSELFMELLGDTNASVAFIKGIVPKDIQSELDKQDLTTLSIVNPNN